MAAVPIVAAVTAVAPTAVVAAAVVAAVVINRLESLPKFLLLQWHITHRCPQFCLHCYEDPDKIVEQDINFSQLETFLGYYVEVLESGTPEMRGHIHVTGGDPMAHPDIFPFLQMLASHHKRLSFDLLAGPGLITPQSARRLAALQPRYVQLSLDGEPETHDRLRGAGSHKQTVAAVRLLTDAGVRVVISFTSHAMNWQQFPSVARLARRLGVYRVWADRHIPLGRGDALRNDVMSPAQTRDFCQSMEQARKRPWPFANNPVSCQRALQFLVSGGQPYRCEAGNRLLALTPEGTVLPCRRLPLVAGRLGESSLLDIYLNSPVLRQLRQPKTPQGCEGCWHQQSCSGGLRCLSHAVQTPWVADPGCWLAKR